MPRARVKMANKKSLYLCNTEVENLFINEFLPTAPADYVKVYLFCLMYAQHNQDVTSVNLETLMGISGEDLNHAWEYWERLGLVQLHRNEQGEIDEIEFLSLTEKLYGSRLTADSGKATSETSKGANAAESAEAADDEEDEEDEEAAGSSGNYAENDEARFAQVIDASISELYSRYIKYAGEEGRTVSSRELQVLSDAIKVYKITPDVMGYAIKYCAEELGKCHANYMLNVARRWADNGCRSIDQVREYIDKYSRRNSYYQTVFKQMGFYRTPGPGDKELMDKWVDGMGFTLAEVLEACKKTVGKRDPNLQYVDKVLENWLKEKGGIDPWQTSNRTVEQINADLTGKGVQSVGSTGTPSPVNTSAAPKVAVSKQVLEDYYEFLRNEAVAAQKARMEEACERIPEMEEVLAHEKKLLAALIAGGNSEQRRAIRSQKSQLGEYKSQLLKANGLNPDYLELKYRCPVCKDTGLTDDGRICTCREARAEEAFRWNQTRNQK